MYQQRSEGEDTMLKCFPSWTISTHFYRAENSCSLTLRLSCGTGDIMSGHCYGVWQGLVFSRFEEIYIFWQNQELRVKTLHFRGQNESRHVFGSGVSPGFVETLALLSGWLRVGYIYDWQCHQQGSAWVDTKDLLDVTVPRLEMFLTRRVNNRRAIIWGWNFKGTGHIFCISGIPNIFLEVFTKVIDRKDNSMLRDLSQCKPRWWFQIFCFTAIWGRFPMKWYFSCRLLNHQPETV